MNFVEHHRRPKSPLAHRSVPIPPIDQDAPAPHTSPELETVMGFLTERRSRVSAISSVGHARDDASRSAANAIVREWEVHGGEVLGVVDWPEDAASWMRQATRLVAGAPDAWVVAGYPLGWAQMGCRLRHSTDWDPERTIAFSPYKYTRTADDCGGGRVADFPDWMVDLGRSALVDAYQDPAAGDGYAPDAALINYYEGPARLGMHQDKDEKSDSPVVSLSIGDTCVFRFGNTENRNKPYTDLELASGDLFVFGGPSRFAYHGVPKTIPGTADLRYHDTEWGVPVRGEPALFERVSLEAFQAGLSWLTILIKRPAFRVAFDDFDPEIVAGYTDEDVDRLMNDEAIVRNRAKVEAARTNARAVLNLRESGGLDALIWSHKPD